MLDLAFRLTLDGTVPSGLPSFVAATTAYTPWTDAGVNKTMVVPYPAGWANGDTIFLYVTDQLGTSGAPPVFPAGWTVLRTDAANGCRAYTAARTVATGDTPSVTVTGDSTMLSGGVPPWIAAALLYRYPQSPLVNTAAFARDTIHTIDELNNLPSVTPTRDGLLLGMYMKRTGLGNITLPAGMTLRAFRPENGPVGNNAIYTGYIGVHEGFTVAVAEKAATSGVASGSLTATWTGGSEPDNRYGQVLVI